MDERGMVDLLAKVGILDDSTAEGSRVRISTHIPTLDALLHGGLAAGLHCVTGGPASYKTSTMLNVAYRAACDGMSVLYVTDEVAPSECKMRLASMRMRLDGMRDAPAWASLVDVALRMAREGDSEGAERIATALREVDAASLDVMAMGPRIGSDFSPYRNFGRDVMENLRYIPSTILSAESAFSEGVYNDEDAHLLGYNLIVIDPVNSLRMFEVGEDYRDSDRAYYLRDRAMGERERMEEVVELLDRWARDENRVVVGVFHANRTGAGVPKAPSMADFKGTSKVEYQAVTALKLVRYSDMDWTGHPRAPFTGGDGMEAVALYVLKNRQGGSIDHPIPLVADGAHSLTWEYRP